MEYLSYPIGFNKELEAKFEEKLSVINENYKKEFKALEACLKTKVKELENQIEEERKSAVFIFSVASEDLKKDDDWSIARKGDRVYRITKEFVGEIPEYEEEFYKKKTYGGFILVNNVIINIGSGYVLRSGTILSDHEKNQLDTGIVPEKIKQKLNW